MTRSWLSKLRPLALLSSLALTALAACATGREAEVGRLRAQATYELALTDLCLNRPRNEPCEPRISPGLAALQEAISLDPRQAVYQNTLGFVHLNLKNLPQATDAFKKALELNPDYAEAQHNLGVALAESGQWEEAIKAYQKTLAMPSNARAGSVYTNMGWAYYSLGRLDEAERALQQAVRFEPTLGPAYYHLGLVFLKAERREEARAAFRRVVELEPPDEPDSVLGRAAQAHLKALGEGGER